MLKNVFFFGFFSPLNVYLILSHKNCSFSFRSVPSSTLGYQWPTSPILPPISSRTPHLVPETLTTQTSIGHDNTNSHHKIGGSWIEFAIPITKLIISISSSSSSSSSSISSSSSSSSASSPVTLMNAVENLDDADQTPTPSLANNSFSYNNYKNNNNRNTKFTKQRERVARV